MIEKMNLRRFSTEGTALCSGNALAWEVLLGLSGAFGRVAACGPSGLAAEDNTYCLAGVNCRARDTCF